MGPAHEADTQGEPGYRFPPRRGRRARLIPEGGHRRHRRGLRVLQLPGAPAGRQGRLREGRQVQNLLQLVSPRNRQEAAGLEVRAVHGKPPRRRPFHGRGRGKGRGLEVAPARLLRGPPRFRHPQGGARLQRPVPEARRGGHARREGARPRRPRSLALGTGLDGRPHRHLGNGRRPGTGAGRCGPASSTPASG